MSTFRPMNMVRTIDLGHEQMLVIEDRPGSCVRVLLGGVWLTEERHAQDRFARAGGGLCLQAPGRAVIEAIGPTRLQVFEPVKRARDGWRRLVRLVDAARRALQGLPMRLTIHPLPDEASWSSMRLGTSEGRPTISGSTEPNVCGSFSV